MKKTNPTPKRKNAKLLFEVEKNDEGQILIEQFDLTDQNFKLDNVGNINIKKTACPSNLSDNLLGTTVGLASGYLVKKIVVGKSDKTSRKLFGLLLELGVANFVAHHPKEIKSFGRYIFQLVFRKKK